MPSRVYIGQAELNATEFLGVNDRVSQLRLNHAFKIANGFCPKYLDENLYKRIQTSKTHLEPGVLQLTFRFLCK